MKHSTSFWGADYPDVYSACMNHWFMKILTIELLGKLSLLKEATLIPKPVQLVKTTCMFLQVKTCLTGQLLHVNSYRSTQSVILMD